MKNSTFIYEINEKFYVYKNIEVSVDDLKLNQGTFYLMEYMGVKTVICPWRTTDEKLIYNDVTNHELFNVPKHKISSLYEIISYPQDQPQIEFKNISEKLDPSHFLKIEQLFEIADGFCMDIIDKEDDKDIDKSTVDFVVRKADQIRLIFEVINENIKSQSDVYSDVLKLEKAVFPSKVPYLKYYRSDFDS